MQSIHWYNGSYGYFCSTNWQKNCIQEELIVHKHNQNIAFQEMFLPPGGVAWWSSHPPTEQKILGSIPARV
jgi:hypothetical protein